MRSRKPIGGFSGCYGPRLHLLWTKMSGPTELTFLLNFIRQGYSPNCPSRSPDPIRHIWNGIGKTISQRSPFPGSPRSQK
ncbi:hypothetical protein TNCV_3924071 [Trichonephila clavipes]|nr:hypothetical protein TNCV_3924071 [Trichonephila clavipes]